MKKIILSSTCAALALTLASGGGNAGKAKTAGNDSAAETKAAPAVPEYTVLNNPTVDLSTYPKDKDGYYVIFDGKTFNGWRGYGKDKVPSRWTTDDGATQFNGSGGGGAQTGGGGELILRLVQGEHGGRFGGIAHGVAVHGLLAEVVRERDRHALVGEGLGRGVKRVGAAAAGEHGHKQQRADNGGKGTFHVGGSPFLSLEI